MDARPDDDPLDEIIERTARSAALPVSLARRIVEDVVAQLGEPLEGVVRRRHRELQSAGLTNPEIFDRIADELARRPVAAPHLSQRQLRRLVYG